MVDAIVLPLLIVVLVNSHIVRRISNGKIGVDPLVRRELWQQFIADPNTYSMSIFEVNLYSHRVISHLTDPAIIEDIKAFYYLQQSFPVPYVGLKFEVLGTEIDQCETHIFPLQKC